MEFCLFRSGEDFNGFIGLVGSVRKMVMILGRERDWEMV